MVEQSRSQARVANTATTPFYLNRSDVRADVLEGLRSPRSHAESYAASLRRVRRSAGRLMRWLVDPTTLSGSYSRGSSRSEYAVAASENRAVNLDYALAPAPAQLSLAGRAVRLNPTSIRFRTGFFTSESERTAFQVPVALAADSARRPLRSSSRLWRSGAGVDLLPLAGLQLRLDGGWVRDLRDYGDTTVMGRVIRGERGSLLGLDAGFEAQRTVNSSASLTTQLWGVLRPRAVLTSLFQLTRDPNAPRPARTEADTAGAFRIPASFTNSRRSDFGLQLDLRAAFHRAIGCKSEMEVRACVQPAQLFQPRGDHVARRAGSLAKPLLVLPDRLGRTE